MNAVRQVYDWNGAWLYRNELTETGERRRLASLKRECVG